MIGEFDNKGQSASDSAAKATDVDPKANTDETATVGGEDKSEEKDASAAASQDDKPEAKDAKEEDANTTSKEGIAATNDDTKEVDGEVKAGEGKPAAEEEKTGDDTKKEEEFNADEPPPLGVAVPLGSSTVDVKTEDEPPALGDAAQHSGDSSKRPTWEDMFQCLVAYKAERGDCYVSDRFKTKEGKCLGLWVRNQRREGKKWRRDKGIAEPDLTKEVSSAVKKEEEEAHKDEPDKKDDKSNEAGDDKPEIKKEGEEKEDEAKEEVEKEAKEDEEKKAEAKEDEEKEDEAKDGEEKKAEAKEDDKKPAADENKDEETKQEDDKPAVKKESDSELLPGPRPNKPILLEDTRPSKLTDEQYQRLTDLGLDWNSQEERFEAQWEAKLELLKTYKQSYGDCKVPYTFEDDPSLAKWVSQQRTLYHQGRLPQHRLDQLTALEFCWKVHLSKKRAAGKENEGDGAMPSKSGTRKTTKEDAQWEKQYSKLVLYHEKNGHSRVPDRYAADRSLGTWVKKQRLAFAHNRIKEERKEKLEKLGFLWRIVDRQNKEAWDAMLDKLKTYQNENQGDLHVPRTTPQIEDRPLARWVKTQRELYKKGKLLPDRQEKLEELGFQWEVKGGRYKSKDTFKKEKTPTKEPEKKRKAEEEAEEEQKEVKEKATEEDNKQDGDNEKLPEEETKAPANKKQKTEEAETETKTPVEKEEESGEGKEEDDDKSGNKRKRATTAETPSKSKTAEEENDDDNSTEEEEGDDGVDSKFGVKRSKKVANIAAKGRAAKAKAAAGKPQSKTTAANAATKGKPPVAKAPSPTKGKADENEAKEGRTSGRARAKVRYI